MVRRHEAVRPADLGLERGDSRAHELDHPAADGADQVIVVLPAVDVLVEEAPAAELLAGGEAALDEKIEVPIDGGARDFEAPSPHRRQERLGIDMLVLGEDLLEEGEPLFRHPLAAATQVGEELLLFADLSHGFPAVPSLMRLSLNNAPVFWTGAVLFVNPGLFESR